VSSGSPDRAALLDALMTALQRASGTGVLLSQTVADRVGMNPTDLEVLDILFRAGPVTAGQLATLTGLTTGAVTGLIDRLEAGGFARRERDLADRRRVIVHANPEAGQRIAPLFDALARAMHDLAARYTDAELATILDFTDRADHLTHERIDALREEAAAAKTARTEDAGQGESHG